MIRFSLSLEDRASARLQEIAAYLARPVALYKDCGRRLANDLRAHFAKLNNEQPNALGGPRTFFWADVRNAVQQPLLDALGVSVTIAHLAFAQKLFGGPIVAKNWDFLTIPKNALAHGRRAATFAAETGIKLFRLPKKGAKAISKSAGRARFAADALQRLLYADMGAGPVPIYALVRRVVQDPEPRALPDRALLVANIMDTAEKNLARAVVAGQ